jgi:hypothetical protein
VSPCTVTVFGSSSLARPRRWDRAAVHGNGVRIVQPCATAALGSCSIARSQRSDRVTCGGGARIVQPCTGRAFGLCNIARPRCWDRAALRGHGVRIVQPCTATAFGSLNLQRPRHLVTWDILICQTLGNGNGLDVANWTALVCPQTGLCRLLLDAVKANRTSFKQVVTLCVDKPV